ncbi:hypothetical protein HDU81_009502 [Chytriomyces hyalinus]|nr:hypothetical protein HDU81_009502 [Chytriomyces hyalinus]
MRKQSQTHSHSHSQPQSRRRSSASVSVSSASSSATPTQHSMVMNMRRQTHSHPLHGSVGALKPTPVVPLDQNASVYEAACYMASRRVDAVLVSATAHASLTLAGIATDKDLVYRVVADGLDPRTATLKDIMTPDPVKVLVSDSATHALNSMISGHFRHLPVLDRPLEYGGAVIGLLDVTKCLYDSLEKLESVVASSRSAALRESQDSRPDASTSSTAEAAMAKYAEILRQQLAGPNLSTLLASETSIPPVAEMHDTVAIACQRMKEGKETAVLVFDSDGGGGEDEEEGLGNLCGIFTSKDLVLRVLAAGLDPKTTLVSRVMTPHPECVTPETPVLEALRKMHIGRYLHLPVIDAEGVIEGLVDVLKLTYTTLDQLSQVKESGVSTGAGNPAESGNGSGGQPVWDRFWEDAGSVTSYGGGGYGGGDNGSMLSASRGSGGGGRPYSMPPPVAFNRPPAGPVNSRASVSGASKYGGPPVGMRERQGSTGTIADDGGSIYPDDSASVIASGDHSHQQHGHIHRYNELSGRDAHSMMLMRGHHQQQQLHQHQANLAAVNHARSVLGGVAPSSVGTSGLPPGLFAFKLRDFEAKTTHRFTSSAHDLESLQGIVNSKIRTIRNAENAGSNNSLVGEFQRVCYVDDEGDIVRLDTDADLVEAVEVARRCGWGRVVVVSESQRRFFVGIGGDLAGAGVGLLPGGAMSEVGTVLSGRNAAAGGGGGSGGGSGWISGAVSSLGAAPGIPITYMDHEDSPADGSNQEGGGTGEKDSQAAKSGGRTVRLEEIEQMEAMVAPALVGAGIAVVCAFLLGRAFK